MLMWHLHGSKKQMHFEDNQYIFFSIYETDVTYFCSTELNIAICIPSPSYPAFLHHTVLGLLSDKLPLLLHSLSWGYYRTNLLVSSFSSSHPSCLHPHHANICMYFTKVWPQLPVAHTLMSSTNWDMSQLYLFVRCTFCAPVLSGVNVGQSGNEETDTLCPFVLAFEN